MHYHVREHCAQRALQAYRCAQILCTKLVEDKLINLMPYGAKEMTADALTKSLLYPSFRTHSNTMLDVTSQQKMPKTLSCACWTWTQKEASCDGGATESGFLATY